MAKKSSSTSLVKYGDFTEDDAEEDLKELERSGGGGVFLKAGQGKTVIRVIPPRPGKSWKRTTHVHYVDVPGAGRVSFTCPKKEAKQFCIVCKRISQLLATGEQRDEKKARDLQPKRRSFCNAIDRANPLDGPRVFPFGKQIERQLIEMRKDPDLGGNFVDPVKGVDVAIIAKGTGMSTEYKVVAANKGKVCPLSADRAEMDEWIQNQHNLDKFAEVLDADEIEALLKGEKPEGNGRKRGKSDDEEDEKPSSKKRSSKSIDEEIEDAEVDDEDEDEAEDEDEEIIIV